MSIDFATKNTSHRISVRYIYAVAHPSCMRGGGVMCYKMAVALHTEEGTAEADWRHCVAYMDAPL